MPKFSVFLKFVIGFTLGITLAALVAFNALILWVATGPRSLDKVTPYLERSLVGESDVRAQIGHTWLLWGGWQRPLDLRLKEVSLFTKDGKRFSSFPDISVGLDLLALPFGQLLPTSLSVSKPIISFKQHADKTLGFDRGDAPQEEGIASAGASLEALIQSLLQPRSGSSLRKLKTIELLNADVTIGNETDGVILSAPDTTFVVRKQYGSRIHVVLRSAVHYAERESRLDLEANYNPRKKRLEGNISATQIYPALLSELFVNDPRLSALRLPMTLKSHFAIADTGVLDQAQFVLEGGRGTLVHPRLEAVVPVSRMRLLGQVTDAGRKIVLQKAEADFSGSIFTGTATMLRAAEGLGITGQASITDVDMAQARAFWPLELAPLSRAWVVENIRDGGISKAAITMNIKPGDLEKPLLPKESIDARLELKDAKIRYLEGHPELRSVNALIHVDGMTLDANIAHANAFKDTLLTKGRVLIQDLNPDNPLIELSMHADATAADLVTLLGLPMLEHAKHLNLTASKASGRAQGDAALSFYFFAKDAEGKDTPMTYDIRAQADKISTPALLQRFDIEDATGAVHINEQAIEFSGAARINGAPLHEGTIRYAFTPEEGVDTRISAQIDLNEASLRRFGVALPMPVRDLPATALNMKLLTQGAATEIKELTMVGQGLDLAGRAILTTDGSDLARLWCEKLHYDRTRLSKLEYTSIEGGYQLTMEGEALDLAPLFGEEATAVTPETSAKKPQTPPSSTHDKKDFSFEHFPGMDLTLDVRKLYLGHQVAFSQAQGSLLCSQNRCRSASLSAIQGDQKRVQLAIRPEGKNRRFTLSAQDGGALLRGLGVLDSVEEGALSISGLYDDVRGDGKLSGTLTLSDYSVKHAPVLAKLLSLASLTGFFDTLSGNGIAFKKLQAPFTLYQDVLTLNEAKTFGSAMGMTADGTITFPQTRLDLEGTLVPSYTANNVLGNLPLLGNILTGGEGQGVFAANYTMKGSSEDPEVMVNPLSILTPGFLRRLFDIF